MSNVVNLRIHKRNKEFCPDKMKSRIRRAEKMEIESG
jgi:hypothetical protein